MATDARPSIVPIPEPDLTPEAMIERAVDLRDQLRADQDGADKRGFYSEALHEAFTKAGFYRMLQPRMFGGYEFDLATYYRISVEVAHGGGAGIAWCLNLAHHHSYIVGSFWPEQAQREIESAGKAARQELREFAAGQSVQLAEEMIRRDIKPEDDARLVGLRIEELGGVGR
jgi:alkylation response protein AidB-like acyl-CoA dehydrogenase